MKNFIAYLREQEESQGFVSGAVSKVKKMFSPGEEQPQETPEAETEEAPEEEPKEKKQTNVRSYMGSGGAYMGSGGARMVTSGLAQGTQVTQIPDKINLMRN